MNNLINWLENSFAPKMNKFNHNTWVVTIKDSIMQVLPFILLGSLFCVGTVIEGFVTLPFLSNDYFSISSSKWAIAISPFNTE